MCQLADDNTFCVCSKLIPELATSLGRGKPNCWWGSRGAHCRGHRSSLSSIMPRKRETADADEGKLNIGVTSGVWPITPVRKYHQVKVFKK